MGGDQAGGLGLAIGLVMLLMLVGGVVVFVLVARRLTRNQPPGRRGLVVALMALAGAGLGWLLVMSTFYESSWSPPPRLVLTAAPGFDAPVVVLLEDPRATRTIETQGGSLPFSTAMAEVEVPPNGIVRLRDFGAIGGNAALEVVWPDGRQSPGAGGGPGPPGSGARSYLAIERPDAQYPGVLMAAEAPAVGAYVSRREREFSGSAASAAPAR